MVAAPAGALIWILANVHIGESSIIGHLGGRLQGFGHLLGLDGYIILAFLLGLPANELVIPILIMSYLSEGVMLELDSLEALRSLLVANGWTWLTALNMILFSLLHFPCGTAPHYPQGDRVRSGPCWRHCFPPVWPSWFVSCGSSSAALRFGLGSAGNIFRIG